MIATFFIFYPLNLDFVCLHSRLSLLQANSLAIAVNALSHTTIYRRRRSRCARHVGRRLAHRTV